MPARLTHRGVQPYFHAVGHRHLPWRSRFCHPDLTRNRIWQWHISLSCNSARFMGCRRDSIEPRLNQPGMGLGTFFHYIARQIGELTDHHLHSRKRTTLQRPHLARRCPGWGWPLPETLKPQSGHSVVQ